ncbi:TonB-dependent receptor domain-containing protein [Dyadobacter sp. CY312]|uniref:TonB-dependent receptor domain-containing protein n=1 Tax=Dyadobacter sp. CY312 TaxID=2907303 RepID=UPI001F48A19C|nr:TonB-dependent receptor [Dyadobacter sp. CY312]MCE7041338.1 TonB-dependent receptor [Dyadobacter sp. CY312]
MYRSIVFLRTPRFCICLIRKLFKKNLVYSGNLGLVYLPGTFSKISLTLSTGFRAPNIDDLAKVFESADGTQLVVPNPDLKPEQTLDIDLGLSHRPDLGLGFALNAYYTFFRNAIVMNKFELNSHKEVVYAGKLTPVVASQNKAEAYIYGFEGSLTYQVKNSLAASMTLNASARWAVHRNLNLHVAVENILDRNYRVFASGIHNPGRNFVVKLVSRF